MLSNDGKLDELARQAMELFNALSPEEQREHRRLQRISWVKGELMLEHEDMAEERAQQLAEEAVAKRG